MTLEAPPVLDIDSLRGSPGYIRVGRDTEGRWWFLGADGQPFFARCACAVNRAGTQGGRLAVPGPYADAVDRIYDYAEGPDAFVEAVLKRLRDWGFNAFGSWVTEEFFDRGLPYPDILECNKLDEAVRLKGPGINVPDVFDPAWQRAVEDVCARLCPPRRDKKDFMGWFTDNELGWGQPGTDHIWGAANQTNAGAGQPTLLQFCLTLPPERPAHDAAWAFVRDRRGDGLAEAWARPEAADPAALTRWTEAGGVLDTRAYGEDQEAFSYRFARAYFDVTHAAIRRHDPHHLVLGVRFGAPPGETMLRAHADAGVHVVSGNNYRDTMWERVEQYAGAAREPVLIGEFSWSSDYFVLPERHPAPLCDLSVAERVRAVGRAALERAATHPCMVGYTWYRWVQGPSRNHPELSYGLVDREDRPHALNTGLLALIHPDLDDLHAGRREPTDAAAAAAESAVS